MPLERPIGNRVVSIALIAPTSERRTRYDGQPGRLLRLGRFLFTERKCISHARRQHGILLGRVAHLPQSILAAFSAGRDQPREPAPAGPEARPRANVSPGPCKIRSAESPFNELLTCGGTFSRRPAEERCKDEVAAIMGTALHFKRQRRCTRAENEFTPMALDEFRFDIWRRSSSRCV